MVHVHEREDEMCQCGDLKSEHGGIGIIDEATKLDVGRGHGACTECPCPHFAWAGFVRRKKTMKTYDVGIREVHVNTIQVKARNIMEAKERAEAEAQTGVLNLEYSHTLDQELWTAEEVVR